MPPILMRMKNARTHINYLINSKQSFELSSSNYTTGIKCDDKALCAKYVATMQTNRTFACFAKLKKAVKKRPVPDVKPEDVRYFQHNFKSNIYIDTVYNIDLKSAYATILFNEGFIDKETYVYVCAGSKQERLASVGMLASRKEIFSFHNGVPISETEVVSENSGFFFYAAKRTFDIMDELKRICGQDYLYTWVDGIYFLPNVDTKEKCQEYLQSSGLKNSFDQLQEFEVRIKQNEIVVTFKKGAKLRRFSLPPIVSEFKRIIMDSILLINKNKNNEKSKIENSGFKNRIPGAVYR